MTIVSRLRTILTAEIEDYRKDMKAAGESAKRFGNESREAESGLGKFSAGLQSVGSLLGTLGLTFGFMELARVIKEFGTEAVNVASDVAEMRSKFGVVFRDLAGDVERQLGVMGEAINRSKYDLMEYAATFQDTFVPLGFARDQAAEMSVALVQLAEDLGSFNNLPTADVARDLQSALVGNTETVRKYGVVANEAAIKAKALELGLWDGTGAIDAQAKAASILQIIMEGTADAQGDAARTAGSYENQTRGLDAALKDLKVTVGNMFLPELQKGLPVLTDWVDGLAGGIDVTNQSTKAYELGAITLQQHLYWTEQLWKGKMTEAEVTELLTSRVELYNERNADARDLMGEYATGQQEVIEANKAAAVSAEELATEQEQLNQAMKDLSLFVRGPLGQELESFKERNAELEEQLAAVGAEIENLQEKGFAEQSEEVQALRGKYGELQAAITANEQEHDRATKEILFDLLSQRAALDGLTESEFQLLTDIAENWGLVDQATREAALAMDTALRELATGESFIEVKRQILDLRDTVNEVPTDIEIRFNMTTTGSPPPQTGGYSNPYIPQAAGGDWIVTGPTLFLAGEAGKRERAIFIPEGEEGFKGEGNGETVYNVTQNFYDAGAAALGMAIFGQERRKRLNASMI